MAREERIVQILLSSPSDVAAERGSLRAVVEEFNLTWRKFLGISYEVLSWETHSIPGMGSDAQSVINVDMGDEYDLFLGILGARFGTPTPRAGSGTKEEFDRALKRYKEDSESVDLMVYFRAINADANSDKFQFGKIKEFKKTISESGCLYCDYESNNQFKYLVRIHLSRRAQKYSTGISEQFGVGDDRTVDARTYIDTKEEVFERIGDSEQIDTPDEMQKLVLGASAEKLSESENVQISRILKNLVLGSLYLTKAQSYVSNTEELMNSFSDVVRESSSRIKSFGANRRGRENFIRIEQAMLAKEIVTMADELEENASQYNMWAETGIDIISRSLIVPVLIRAANEDQRSIVEKPEFYSVAKAITGFLGSLSMQLEAIEDLPSSTKSFKRAQKRYSVAIREMIKMYTSARSLWKELAELVDKNLIVE